MAEPDIRCRNCNEHAPLGQRHRCPPDARIARALEELTRKMRDIPDDIPALAEGLAELRSTLSMIQLDVTATGVGLLATWLTHHPGVLAHGHQADLVRDIKQAINEARYGRRAEEPE